MMFFLWYEYNRIGSLFRITIVAVPELGNHWGDGAEREFEAV
jgi:hypothetical protein